MFIHKAPSQYRLFSADPPTAGARTQTWDDVLLFFACTFANYKHPNIGRYSMLKLNCRKFKTEVISIANHNSQCLQINEWGKIIKLSSSAGKRAQINQGWESDAILLSLLLLRREGQLQSAQKQQLRLFKKIERVVKNRWTGPSGQELELNLPRLTRDFGSRALIAVRVLASECLSALFWEIYFPSCDFHSHLFIVLKVKRLRIIVLLSL